jgi:site-specific DNA-methyltransferase (adenine-specific)
MDLKSIKKGNGINQYQLKNILMSCLELAWTSFESALRIFDYARGNASGFAPKLKYNQRIGINLHPTQKPVALYEWLLMNYAKEGDKILDTHLGSGSIAIACHNLKYDLTACELDTEYFDAAMKRLKDHQKQITMW